MLGTYNCSRTVGTNGFVAQKVKDELGRYKKPQPQYINRDYDDTDYVKEERYFYPGCMVMSSAGSMVSAGIAVERRQDLHVTVAFHY